MAKPYFLKKLRWWLLEVFNRRNFPLDGSGPIVSFTFDDFPQSAFHIGARILKSYGACGTYYTSMGLMNQVNDLGRHFSQTDLTDLIREGHELGCHTFDHLSCRSSAFKDFQADVIKGLNAVEQMTENRVLQQFSYPKGHVTLRAKRKISENFSSCRGIIPGINESPVDLNLLRANSLYSSSFDIDAIKRLFDANDRCNGWLIFYTHDISEKPSAFGCTEEEFESVVKLAAQSQANILPIGKVVRRD